MIEIKPFRAIRPSRDKAYLVATRSYVTYSDSQLDDKLRNNPYTFLHVINPDSARNMPFGKAKYRHVRRAFEAFQTEGILLQDDKPAFYLYRQVKEGAQFVGLIAAIPVEAYQKDLVKKHEKTLTMRERMFADYLEVTAFNAEPVLLTYERDEQLEDVFNRVMQQRAEYEFTSTDKVLHEIWLIDQEPEIESIQRAMAKQQALYIADGHHRSASSNTLYKRVQKEQLPLPGASHFMAYLIADSQMEILPFSRLVKWEQAFDFDTFLSSLKEDFDLVKSKGAIQPTDRYHFGMYAKGNWYNLRLKEQVKLGKNPVEALDTQLLYKKILKPHLHIGDPKTDPHLSFLPGNESLEALQALVDLGNWDMAFTLHPVEVEQMKQVADAGKTMPPKSTYIEPKLRSGLLVYSIDQAP